MSAEGFQRKYTDEQRRAMAIAFSQRHTAPVVAQMAAAGELTGDGGPLPPFETNPSTVRDVHRKWRIERGDPVGTRAGLSFDDELSSARAELMRVFKRKLRAISRRQRGGGEGSIAELRELAQLYSLMSSMPAVPGAARAALPSQAEPGASTITIRPGSIAAALVADLKADDAPTGGPVTPATRPGNAANAGPQRHVSS